MIAVKHRGDFSKTEKWLRKNNSSVSQNMLEHYGRLGVEALRNATPVDTGKTSDSWSFEIRKTNNGIILEWLNSNVVNEWANVAILLQYGHATGTGGYVYGIDYINPALRPIFDKLAKDAWEEVVKP